MKKLLILTVCLLICVALIPQEVQQKTEEETPEQTEPAKPAPWIQFEKTVINFGEIDSGKFVEVIYKFENISQSVLKIKNISTSCGCTVTKLFKTEYQPGEKGEIPVKFNSKGRSGRVIHTITVSTNDHNNVYTRLKLMGMVKLKDFSKAELFPNSLDFEEVNIGEKYQKVVKIKNTGTSKLMIIELIHNPEIITELNKKSVEPNEDAELIITLKPMERISRGDFTSFLKIRTNAYRQYLLVIKIQAKIEK